MICPKCSEENIQSANFCRCCGYPFTDEDRKTAYNSTIYGKLDKAKTAADIVTGQIITDTIWFKVLSIVVILALGIWFRMSGAHGLRLEGSDDYEIRYLEKTNTYYLIAEDEEVPLRLVVPHGTKTLKLKELDEDEFTITSETYDLDEGITLSVSGQSHYKLSSFNGKKTTGTLKLYLYLSE